MAATSGSGPSACWYDVFLSFRGPDTRDNFTDCLHGDLVGQGIIAYIDSKDLHAGNRIDDLLNAVGNSKICIPILSKGYASSAWCLRELTRAMDLKESTGKPAILPIFFDVTPLDVKLRTNAYLEDMKKQEQRYGKETRQKWEAALRKVAEIKGYEVQGKKQGEIIDLVVRDILGMLKVKQRPLPSKLVGVDEQAEAIMKLLDVDSGAGMHLVGIIGMGGIGKTTLAKVVFNKLCPQFDGQCSFLGNVRESSNRYGLVDLQKKLGSDISDSKFVENFIDTDEGIVSIRRRACSKKVLIVLDDLDKKEQLDKLVGGAEFGYGSKIIITTRDKGILNEVEGILVYEVKEMDHEKALKLFTLHAFKSIPPPDDTLQVLSRQVVSTTGGLPLALEVIGSSLKRKDENGWKAMLEKLKTIPHKDVQATLKISYDVLDYNEKETFLDIACFFIGEKKSRVTYYWEACKLCPRITLEDLKDLCLIKINDHDDTIWMHDQLRDLGREIVREECTMNLTGCTRLWDCEEALEVVKSKERKDKLQALTLVNRRPNPISIAAEELERMPNLKILNLRYGTFVGDVSRYLQKLRWFSWDPPPLDRTVAKLHLKNLVVFKLPHNLNNDNWGGWNILKMENKLKVLYLSGDLKRIPDFSGYVSLEELTITSCHHLQEVNSSIGKLKGLTSLTIKYCCRLQNLPEEIGGLVKLEDLHIEECNQLYKISFSIGKLASLSKLSLRDSGINYLPESIGNAKHLSLLDLSLTWIVKLPDSIGELLELKFLKLDCCRWLWELPESIGNLTSLQELNIVGTKIVELPDSIQNLKQLKVLRMSSTQIRRLPAGIGMLERLEELHAYECEQLEGELPTEIGGLSSLRYLNISSTRVCAVPTAIISLTRLQELYLMDCDELEELPKLPPSLTHLYVQSKSLRLVRDLSDLTNLEELELSSGFGQASAHASSPMHTLQLQWLGKLSKLETLSIDAPAPPTELGRLTGLTCLTLCGLDSFDSVTFGQQISNLNHLSKLHLQGCRLREMQLAGLELLAELQVGDSYLLEGLSFMSSSLRKIRTISVQRCPRLREIRFLGAMMESLERLEISYCESLAVLRVLSNAEKLKRLYILNCDEVQVVEVEGLEGMCSSECGSVEGSTDVTSNSKIPNECLISIRDYDGAYGNYKEMIKKEYKLEENDTSDSCIGILGCICKPLWFFQRRSPWGRRDK